MLSVTLPDLCIVTPYPVDSWYIVGTVWAAVLFGESIVLLFLLRGVHPAWPQRLLAGVLALVGIWSVFLSIWVRVDPRTYTFICAIDAPYSPSPFAETSPAIVNAQGVMEDVTNFLVPLFLVIGLSLAILSRKQRAAAHQATNP